MNNKILYRTSGVVISASVINSTVSSSVPLQINVGGTMHKVINGAIQATAAPLSPSHASPSPSDGMLLGTIKTEPRQPPSPSDLVIATNNSYGSGRLTISTASPSKRPKTEDSWVSSPSPGGTSTYTSVPPLSPSPGPPSSNGGSVGQSATHMYTVISNGYSSPMSSGSYDPYSPGGKNGREDLSPTGSINGYSADSCDTKKKKGPTPRQAEELCLVCGDRASGYHYNALTCEGCKGFFRRSITKNAVYQCKYGNNCEIDMYMRRKCQECRLKKCLSVGMRPECVVPEVQCAVKRKEKKAQKDKDKPNSTTNGSPEMMSPDVKFPMVTSELSPEQAELIQRLAYYQEFYESPSEDDLKRIANQTVNLGDPSEVKFRQLTEMTLVTVQLIVEFAKNLPAFPDLLRDDQITLLKACSSEVIMLRMARCYDAKTDSIMFANDEPYTKESYDMVGLGEHVDDLLQFCRFMYRLKVDNCEYALITAIVIFSERPGVLESVKVEGIQDVYLTAMRTYVEDRYRPNAGQKYARLLSVLTELRTLGNQNSEMCFALKLKNRKLPAFLSEIWDIDTKS